MTLTARALCSWSMYFMAPSITANCNNKNNNKISYPIIFIMIIVQGEQCLSKACLRKLLVNNNNMNNTFIISITISIIILKNFTCEL